MCKKYDNVVTGEHITLLIFAIGALMLAIWDAYEGPAYGYGDEEPEDEEDEEQGSRKKRSES